MNYLRTAGRITASACCIFTALLFLFFGGAATVLNEPALAASNALLFFAFSFFFALSNQFLHIRALSIVWRITFHMLATLADFVLVLFVFTGYYVEHGSFTVAAAIAYIIFYILVALAIFFLGRHRTKKAAESTPYKPQYEL